MTRRDIELITRAIRATVGSTLPTGVPAGINTITAVARSLGSALATTNPRFDPDRFLRAAGVAPEIPGECHVCPPRKCRGHE